MAAPDPNGFELMSFAWTVLIVPISWVAWVVKSIITALRDVEKDVAAHKLYAANHFVKHDDLKDTETRILKAISELKRDMKSKADK